VLDGLLELEELAVVLLRRAMGTLISYSNSKLLR